MTSADPTGRKGVFQKWVIGGITIVALVATLVVIGIDRWNSWNHDRAFRRNLSAMVTINTYDKNRKALAQGSGFFMNTTGLLATNAHVIKGMASASARFPSGAFYELRDVKSVDEDADIAVLEFDANETPSVVGLGNSDEVVSGEKVYAIGSPDGLESSVSGGNVSNVRRNVNGRAFIQFTAPISPGSSGGALFDESGNVIGITAATVSNPEGQNLNFAVPINELKVTLTQNRNLSEGSAAFYYAQGTLADNRKELDKAIELYAKATQLNDRYRDAYIALAYAYFEKRQYNLELQCGRRAAACDSSYPDTFDLLGNAYEDIGRYDSAVIAYSRALELEGADLNAMHDFALLSRASSFPRVGQKYSPPIAAVER